MIIVTSSLIVLEGTPEECLDQLMRMAKLGGKLEPDHLKSKEAYMDYVEGQAQGWVMPSGDQLDKSSAEAFWSNLKQLGMIAIYPDGTTHPELRGPSPVNRFSTKKS